MQKRKRLNYIRVAVLVLMAYLKVSKGQITRRPNGLITTELTGLITVVATTAARTTVATTTVATTTITTVFPTTLEPTTPLPALNSPDNFILADVPSNNTVFTVSWDDVQDSRLAVIYNIIVNTLDGPGIETFSDVTSVYTVTGRTPGQEYNVIVVAVDSDNSREEASDEKTLTLRPNIVENLRRHDSSNTSVTSVWNEPLNSVFDSYSIICSSGTAVPITITKDGTLEASCVDVMPGRLHTITVATVSGSQSNSDYVDIWSKPNTVQSLEGDVVTTNSVSVTWSRPDDHTPSYYYIIDCSEGFADNGNITDGTTTATCSPVTAGRVVTVTVTTYSGLESNADSTMVRAKPNSIDALNEESATIDSVTASWRKPAGIVTQYSISCSPGNPQQPVVRDDGRPSKYRATCENISPPGTECTMTVTSVSDTVAGDSRLIKITTYPIPPVLLEAASTERSISVEWQKPNSVVDYYIIECPKGTASPSNITAIDGTLTASCIGLTSPGDTYNISVQSQSNDKLSDAARVIINALPESVTLMKSPSLVDTVSATWARPMGVFEQFYVQCTPSDNAVPLQDVIQFDPDASLYGADCNVSIPGDLYDMTVVSRSGNKNSSSSTLELRALPEAVDSFTVEEVTTTTVELQWTMKNRCDNGGCVWSSFNVSHIPEFSEQIVPQNERSTTFTSLTPGESYTFTIIVLSEDEESSPVTVVDLTDESLYAEDCSVSIPGDPYDMTVLSRSGNQNSSPSTLELRAWPSNVRSVEITNIEQRVVTIEWERPDGVVTGYNTTIESLEEGRGGGESGGFDGDLIDQKHTATFVDLTPGLEYAITICTKSYDEICITPASISIEALPNKPSAPQDLSLEYEDIHTVRVTFSEPALPNGDITEYIIRYSGVMVGILLFEGSYNQEEIVKLYTPEGNPPYSVTISDLVAGYTYTFRVTAVNGGGEGEVAEDEITLEQLGKFPFHYICAGAYSLSRWIALSVRKK
ncbi:Receptor-type tyrosine-protein phosphatase beta [Holothuria leucospilota]|uniref:Receptor-type tyrosine-protein phosphatase beta n=1 Tax=Holothuria leucospilota TaxID=206669 RepID=A0A9Q1BSA6_HOLLE|nr:Receptor-type tyrosine-protein phosphatase beta [Holothuria leucospilota]